MSEVKRYDLEQGGGWDAGGAFMADVPWGDYVSHDDYTALLASHKELVEALKAIVYDHDERVRIYDDAELQPHRKVVMEQGRAALANAEKLNH